MSRRVTMLCLLVLGALALTLIATAATLQIREAYQPTGVAMAGDQLRFKSSVNDTAVAVVPLSAVTAKIQYNVASPYTVSVGKLPKGAYVIGAIVGVTTAFNAGTTNVLTVGTAADPTALVGATDVTEGSVATTVVCHAPAVLAADTEYVLKYTQTGTAATTGVARVTILYCIPLVN